MERDPVGSLLPELAEWAEKQERPAQGNNDEADVLLRLLYEHIGADLGDLQPADLDELLLEYYPRNVLVEDDAELTDVIATVRDLLAFAADTGRLSAQQLDVLQRRVDEIEPRFADAVLDAAVDWLDDSGSEQTDLRELLGLPDWLPPLRLPPDEELAAQARQSPLLDRAKQLALRVVGCTLVDGEPDAPDAIAAAEALGLQVPGSVTELDDIPELRNLWEMALDLGFVEATWTTAALGPLAAEWPDGSDDEVLDAWADALGLLNEEIFQDDDTELDLSDVVSIAVVSLFLSRNEGIPLAELHELIKDVTEDEFAPADAWDRWVQTYGDPADRLVSILADLGAAQASDGIARLTPLGQFAFAGALTEGGVEVRLLPPVDEMTAFDLVDFAKGATDDELAAETESWFEARGAVAGTDELLTAAAAGDAEDRMIAISIAGPRAATAPQRWRQALDEPALRPYAKLTLYQLDPDESDLESTVSDAAWLLVDLLGAALDTVEPDELSDVLAETVPAGQEQEIFEQMWRLDHPDVKEVLALIGGQHPDKGIAKAARRASFKLPAK
ncbi:hypothetical protein MOQ72_38645 [Saccharopolyspora sp. K220]|uniref:hypothetical protein n=1 Tax=Saccharopolyspora soli TaxID=2926618 RepID=UPI001F583521|nr:hypothetical protein [Saccharopolyspora soli]MCI2423355.1 hypothetical protein [Saccharopolyspora soli]